jgi:hypothetical protein
MYIKLAGAFDRPLWYWTDDEGQVEDLAAQPLPNPVTLFFDVHNNWTISEIQQQWLTATGGLAMTCAFDPSAREVMPDGKVAFMARSCWGSNPQRTPLLNYLFAIEAIRFPSQTP